MGQGYRTEEFGAFGVSPKERVGRFTESIEVIQRLWCEDCFDQPFEEIARDRFLIGDETYLQDELRRYNETLGVNHFAMRVQWPGLEQKIVLRTIESLGKVLRTIS